MTSGRPWLLILVRRCTNQERKDNDLDPLFVLPEYDVQIVAVRESRGEARSWADALIKDGHGQPPDRPVSQPGLWRCNDDRHRRVCGDLCWLVCETAIADDDHTDFQVRLDAATIPGLFDETA